ncbi:hypothetical protein B0J13DRAFT_223336 [Dactylonectria estremocensis]|uniref:Uncharacterized protein n=1 Tax=Dactylonectria estremocensis TaxID=1079267 RepID=A0A9P9F8D8_9HYPO|nr:hypothetical protein B0J13DRAFT_223336 [Dactylonectria estremocensis]
MYATSQPCALHCIGYHELLYFSPNPLFSGPIRLHLHPDSILTTTTPSHPYRYIHVYPSNPSQLSPTNDPKPAHHHTHIYPPIRSFIPSKAIISISTSTRQCHLRVSPCWSFQVPILSLPCCSPQIILSLCAAHHKQLVPRVKRNMKCFCCLVRFCYLVVNGALAWHCTMYGAVPVYRYNVFFCLLVGASPGHY